ncbi:MAG: hypothetical protein ACU85U_04215 [Gammaproteobacteria bacterium]|jgi:hypothetical protein
MESFASPIRIPVARASAVHGWLVAAHLFTLGVLIWICPPGLHALLLMLVVAASLVLELRSVGTPDSRCKVLLLGRDDEWSLITPGGERVCAALMPGFFVSTRLVIVRLKPSGARPMHFVLTGANTAPDTFRRLRVRLKHPLSASAQGAAV